jgi:protein-S-isoprenylcysteine O-methyltransferase Ste14
MLYLLRHVLSVLLLPVVVVILVPSWLLHSFAGSDTRWSGAFTRPGGFLGIFLLLAGFVLFAWCVALFVRVGRGTLAPWDPTRRLIAVGPYRYVRNPMITAVIMMLLGQALFRGSWVLGAFTAFFIALNHLYFTGLEEPGLEKRFGESYRLYKANVSRWVPRLTPWEPAE